MTNQPNFPTSENNIACSVEGLNDQFCGNSNSLKILEEFRSIYEERLRQIDEETGGAGMELKMKTLISWVNDLGEQNRMLIETVEQLEREAAERVALLEERLKKSSHIALEYMSKLEEYDNQIWDKSMAMDIPIKATSKLVQAQQTEEILRTRVSNLQNDISNLLELIQRARYDGSWNTNGLSFSEVTYEDIFGPYADQFPLSLQKKVFSDVGVMTTINLEKSDVENASKKERTFPIDIKDKECASLLQKLENSNVQLQKTLQENEQLVKEIECLSSKLKNKSEEVTVLTQNLSEAEKNELEYKVTDLETTFLRLQRSWEHVWDVSKLTNCPDFTLGMKKDQERIHKLCGELKSLVQPEQQCRKEKKKGVGFASPSKQDYIFQVQELQKQLKQMQNGKELAQKQMASNKKGLSDHLLARNVEESRVNIVLAQAAIEETVEELEAVGDVLRDREEKVTEVELFIQSLKNSLSNAQQDFNTHLKLVSDPMGKSDGEEGIFISCWSRIQVLSELFSILTNQCVMSPEIIRHEAELSRTGSEAGADSLHGNIPLSNTIKKINALLQELSHQEKEINEQCIEINNFQEKLIGTFSAVEEACKKFEVYDLQKENFHKSQMQNEQKIKKLQLELESVQDDLEQCLKTFELTDELDSDIE